MLVRPTEAERHEMWRFETTLTAFIAVRHLVRNYPDSAPVEARHSYRALGRILLASGQRDRVLRSIRQDRALLE